MLSILDLEEDGADEDEDDLLNYPVEQEIGYRPYPNKLVCNNSLVAFCIREFNNFILDDATRHY